MPLFTPLQIPKLIELAKKGRIAPVYLLIGQEEELLKEKAKEICEIIKNTGAIVETYDLASKEDDFSELKGFQESLFGLKKVFIVNNIEKLPVEQIKRLFPVFEKKHLFTWFLLAKSLSEEHPLYQYAMEKGVVIPFVSKRKEDFLQMELIKTIKSQGKSIEKSAVDIFISLTGGDYHHFKNELEKLLFYTEEKKVITEQDIWEIIVPFEKGVIYLLGDSLFHSPEKAYEILLNLLDAKIDAYQILGYLYKYFKRMALLSDILKKNPELQQEEYYNNFVKIWQEIKENPVEEIPKPLKELHPYPLFNMKKHLAKVKDLSQIFFLLYETEVAIKKTFDNPEKAFFQFFYKFKEEVLK